MRRLIHAGLLCAGLALMAGPVWAATTSNLGGQVTDTSNNEPLPGVTVTVSSPQLIGGARSAVTDEKGEYRFVALAPGSYTVTASLSGFDEASDQIRLLVGKDAVLNLTLRLQGMTAEAIVTAEAPVVEVTNTTVKTSIDDELVENIPILNRDFIALATLVPGVVDDPDSTAAGVNINGGRIRDTSFQMDGLNITDAATGTRGASVNLDAIQELEVITNGFNAEYGKAQGGIINVITKSGGNDFHGSASYYFRGNVFDDVSNDIATRRDELEEAGDCGGSGGPDCEELVPGQEFKRHDVYLTAEGPIVKDRLWFFATGQVLQDEQVVNGLREEWDAGQTADTKGVSVFAKGTTQLGEKNTLALSFNQDPRDLTNSRLGLDASGGSYWTASVNPDREQGGWLVAGRDTHVFSENLFVEALAGFQKNKVAAQPIDENGFFGSPLIPLDGVYVQFGGVYPFAFSLDRKRVEGKLDATYYADWAGSHTFKTGVDVENLNEKSTNTYAPQLYGWDEATYDSVAGGSVRLPGENTSPVDLNGDGVIDQDPSTLELVGYAFVFDTGASNYDIQGTQFAGYLQDEWQVASNLTLNLGVRLDKELSIEQVDGDKAGGNLNLAPRFGASWDPTGDGKIQVYGNTGITYDKLSLNNLSYAFSGAVSTLYVYHGPHTGVDPADYFRFEDFDPDNPENGAAGGFGGGAPDLALVDPDIKNPYTWYNTLGVKYEVVQDLGVGAALIYREGHDLLQDVETNKEYDPTSPDGTGLISIDPNFDNILLLTNANSSEYRGLQLEVNKRFSNGWQLLANYTLSKAEGDGRDYTRLPSAGQNQDGDDPRLYTQEYSVLSYDRTHVANLSGNFDLPLAFQVGFSGSFQTGTPYSQLFLINQAAVDDGLFLEDQLRNRTYIGGKNSLRLPDQWNLDLHLQKNFDLKAANLQLLADVFNVMDDDTATIVNQNVSYRDFDGDGDNEFSPTFGEPLQRRYGRRFQLGAKLSF